MVLISDLKFDLLLELNNLNYLDFKVHAVSQLDGLWGHNGLQRASEIKFDIWFEVNNLNYPDIHVHISPYSQLSGLWGQGSLQMTSEVTFNTKFELRGLNNLCYIGFVDPMNSNDKSSGQDIYCTSSCIWQP